MEQTGEYRIEAPPQVVWRALNDPDVLARAIDGCQSLEPAGEGAFRAKVKAKVGPVSATFDVELSIEDADPPHAYTLSGQARAGPAGFGRGSATVRLAEDGGATLLRYQVEASVGGKLVQIGQRLLDASARKTADDFFRRFAAIVGPPEGAEASGPAGG